MNDLEQRLNAELDQVRDRIAPPDVDLAGLVGTGRR